LLPIHHFIHHPIFKPLQTLPICQLNTLELLPPPVPVAVPLPLVLDTQAKLDPTPGSDLSPTSCPIMYKIKSNSSCPLSLPLRQIIVKSHSWAPWVHLRMEVWMFPSSSRHTKPSHPALGPTQQPKMSYQPFCTTALKLSWQQST
jgi:hypothetical protein